jgi:hypothetical protein
LVFLVQSRSAAPAAENPAFDPHPELPEPVVEAAVQSMAWKAFQPEMKTPDLEPASEPLEQRLPGLRGSLMRFAEAG